MMTHEQTANIGLGPGGVVGLSRVLVATDFSPHSACALRRAFQLPLRKGAEILLVHALPPADAAVSGRYDEEDALARHALEEAVHHSRKKRARAACEVRGLLICARTWRRIAESCSGRWRCFRATSGCVWPSSLVETSRWSRVWLVDNLTLQGRLDEAMALYDLAPTAGSGCSRR